MSRVLVNQIAPNIKNLIINGNFDIWQRGTSQVITPSGTGKVYSADRWNSQDYFATGQLTVARSTDIPSGINATYSLSTTVNTTITFSGANNHSINGGNQYIEGLNSQFVIGKYITLSFWVKSTTAGAYNVLFANTDPVLATGARYMAGYTINSANTWEKKSVTLLIDPTYGTFNKDNTVGLTVNFMLAANVSGSAGNVGGSLNTWYSSSAYLVTSATNRTEMMASGSVFQLAQITLNEGKVPVPFELINNNITDVMNKCQRYYWKYDSTRGIHGYAGNSTLAQYFVILPTIMRDTPTMTPTASSGFTGTAEIAGSSGNSITSISIFSGNNSAVRLDAVTSGLSAGAGTSLRLTAGYLGFSAEL